MTESARQELHAQLNGDIHGIYCACALSGCAALARGFETLTVQGLMRFPVTCRSIMRHLDRSGAWGGGAVRPLRELASGPSPPSISAVPINGVPMDGRIGRGSPGVAAGGRDVVAGGVELLENTSDVVFDGTNGQGQGLGDVLVGGAVGEELGDLGFPG